MTRYWIIAALIIISEAADAQQLRGTVMDSKTDFPLQGATIFNRSLNTYRRAGADGKYAIIAREGDTIFFSSAGYRRDTISVDEELLHSGYDVGLKTLAVTLDTVQVNGLNYSKDSLARRDDYKEFYAKPKNGITGGNTSQDGFGVSVSPFSYFSKNQKAERRLKKQLKYNEEQEYVDYRFSKAYVHKLTGLTGDELYKFMLGCRPSYQFVRKASQEDMLNYVNAAFREYQKKK